MKSKLFVTSMSSLIGLYGIMILLLIILFEILGIDLSILLITSIVILVIQFLLAPIFMDLSMRWFYKTKFDHEMPAYLKEFVAKVCADNKMKYPKIGYIDDGAPNAFTYGRTKNDARIVVTRGIFELLSEEEVKAVVAHEIGHAVHYDMFLMTAMQLVPLILYYIYDITVTKQDHDEDSGKLAVVGIIAYILYIVSEYVILWFSRVREYYADEFSCIATKNPNALSESLIKIGYGLTTNKTSGKKANVSTVSALGIFDAKASKSLVVSSYEDGKISKDSIKKAARWELWNPWAKWYEFNSTHPLISKRIEAINKYVLTIGQVPFVEFNEKKEESYVDDFIFELLIKYLPVLVTLIFVIFGLIYNKTITNWLLYIGIGVMLLSLTEFIKLNRKYKNKNYQNKTVLDLLGEVKVSEITAIPCTLKGHVIGRGNPGNIFSEDFILKDETGIIFLDYRQPLAIWNTLFGLLKAKTYIDEEVEIKGWYRRSPIPYVEIYTLTKKDGTKKCHTYIVNKVTNAVLFITGIVLTIISFI